MSEVDAFMALVSQQIQRKAKMYDGLELMTSTLDGTAITRGMFSVIEEAGEVSSAITRHRYELAQAECIDVAHSALLLYLAIGREMDKEGVRS